MENILTGTIGIVGAIITYYKQHLQKTTNVII